MPSHGKARPPSEQAALSEASIVRAALAIADEHGLEALSMRAVADRLGRSVMSLYRHVADKERLVALAIDSAFGEESFPADPPAAWRSRLTESARRQWRCYQRHPWIAAVVSFDRPLLGPNGLRETEWAFAGMQSLPVSERDRLQIYLALTAFVHGAAGQLAAEARAERASGMAQTDWWSTRTGQLRDLFATGSFPLIARLAGLERVTPVEWFEFGLGCLLDGIERRVEGGPA